MQDPDLSPHEEFVSALQYPTDTIAGCSESKAAKN
jgi:hypothetical protein